MMGSRQRAQAAETIRAAVASAGGLVTAALIVSAAALVVALAALAVARRG